MLFCQAYFRKNDRSNTSGTHNPNTIAPPIIIHLYFSNTPILSLRFTLISFISQLILFSDSSNSSFSRGSSSSVGRSSGGSSGGSSRGGRGNIQN